MTFSGWRWAVICLAGLILASCADEAAPEVEVPSWAKVAPEQIAEAKKHGVPVAFENDIGMRFVLIPSGRFSMGSTERDPKEISATLESDVHPRHEVTISRPFYMQVTEVTNQQYRHFDPSHMSNLDESSEFLGDEQPVIGVSFGDVERFSGWLSGGGSRYQYRLPTEAEWEYCCRAGSAGPYSFQGGRAAIHEFANYGDARYTHALTDPKPLPDGYAATAPVASFPANAFGLFDMHGNVWEWCADWYSSRYPGAPVVDPTGPLKRDALPGRGGWEWLGQRFEYAGPQRVIRGGSWVNAVEGLASHNRQRTSPPYRSLAVGFRLVLHLKSASD